MQQWGNLNQHQHGAKKSVDNASEGSRRKNERKREDYGKRERKYKSKKAGGRLREYNRGWGLDECISAIVFTQLHPNQINHSREGLEAK